MLMRGSKVKYLAESNWAYENGEIYEVMGYDRELDAWGVKSKIGEIYAVGEDDLEEVTDIPKIVLKSGKNNNTYSLFNDRIVIKGKTETTIDLPKSQDIICFSDMYYENDKLSVFAATTEGYDKRYCLDENLLALEEKGWSK